MGPYSRRLSIAVVASLGLLAGLALATSGSEGGDIDASPTTLDAGPSLLAFDDDTSDPGIEDDATWLPTPRSSSTEANPGDGAPIGSTSVTPPVPAESSPVGDEPPAPTTAPSATTNGPGPTASAPGPNPPPSTEPPSTASSSTVPSTTIPSSTVPSATSPTTSATSTPERPAVVGFAGIEVADFTNSNVNISKSGQDGSFRTVCTVSHFNSDDAIVFPGQRDATHLHMYFGNTLADFSSTGPSLMSSGDATCQGGPLNRSAYWVPAVFDQNGNVRPAQYMLAYYKRAGDEDVVPYPNGLEMVVGNAMAMTTQPGREQPVGVGIDYTWSCGSPITVGKHDAGRLIPNCAPGEFLTLSLIFPRCGDGRLTSSDNKSHMAYPPHYGAACPASHPIRHPQLTYNIHWNNNDTNTGGWYLSSDDHRDMGGSLMAGGTTTHADWIGAWHPEVLEIMTNGCFNADHDCKGGTISPSLRLDSPNLQGHSPANIYDSNASPVILPPPD